MTNDEKSRGRAPSLVIGHWSFSAEIAFDVAYVAELARLHLTAEEAALFQTQLAHVLAHAAKLQELDLEGVEPAAHAVPAANVFRADEPRPSLTQEEALRQAPRAANHLFLVTRVLE